MTNWFENSSVSNSNVLTNQVGARSKTKACSYEKNTYSHINHHWKIEVPTTVNEQYEHVPSQYIHSTCSSKNITRISWSQCLLIYGTLTNERYKVIVQHDIHIQLDSACSIHDKHVHSNLLPVFFIVKPSVHVFFHSERHVEKPSYIHFEHLQIQHNSFVHFISGNLSEYILVCWSPPQNVDIPHTHHKQQSMFIDRSTTMNRTLLVKLSNINNQIYSLLDTYGNAKKYNIKAVETLMLLKIGEIEDLLFENESLREKLQRFGIISSQSTGFEFTLLDVLTPEAIEKSHLSVDDFKLMLRKPKVLEIS
jgi:hypothetical protein